MLTCEKNKIWLESPKNLLCSTQLIPQQYMTLAQQMNCLSRLCIIIFIILFLVGFRSSFLFGILSLLFIIILYYLQRKAMEKVNKEQFTISRNKQPTFNNVMMDNPTSKRFCNDSVPLDGLGGAYNNPRYMSPNQKLVGGPNPKTLIPPVMVPRLADLEYWRANNLVNHSAVNKESQIDVFQSGYQISTCCPDQAQMTAHPQQVRHTTPIEELYEQPYIKNPIENYDGPHIPNPIENYGTVNTSCGYNPRQVNRSGLPSNLGAGNCEQDPLMKQYNQNLFTQTIQPGVYSVNQVNEPINSNIGISFTPQIDPTTCQTNPETGEILFTEHDPNIIEPVAMEPNLGVISAATESNIYDPRFSGYGTSYRSYEDEKLGQTKFYYDDVNAIRMPNYITRSNIDNQPWADHYGPMPPGGAQGNKYNPQIRALANKAFLDSSLQFRTEMQQRLMRKTNSEAWMQRKAPIRTGGQRMLGGMGSCR